MQRPNMGVSLECLELARRLEMLKQDEKLGWGPGRASVCPPPGLHPSARRTWPEWMGWSLSTKHREGVRPKVRRIRSSCQA